MIPAHMDCETANRTIRSQKDKIDYLFDLTHRLALIIDRYFPVKNGAVLCDLLHNNDNFGYGTQIDPRKLDNRIKELEEYEEYKKFKNTRQSIRDKVKQNNTEIDKLIEDFEK